MREAPGLRQRYEAERAIWRQRSTKFTSTTTSGQPKPKITVLTTNTATTTASNTQLQRKANCMGKAITEMSMQQQQPTTSKVASNDVDETLPM
jgi:hypothetical protein